MAITFGSPGSPSQITKEFDTLFTLSLANYEKTLVDQISTSNPFFYKLTKSQGYIGKDGGTHLELPLMYSLGTPGWYDGYDVLDTTPTEGVTMSIWQWSECAVPITVSRKELRQNAHKLGDLVKIKIDQAEMGIKEFLGKAWLQGNGVYGGSVIDRQTNPVNGALGVEPLGSLIRKDPTTSVEIGNINQSTRTWWRNRTKSSTATTYDGFFREVQSVYNECSKGPGGPPDMLLMDQYTYQLFERMLWSRDAGRHPNGTDLEFPFENVKFKRSIATWDEFVPDLENDSPTVAEDSSTGGTIFFLNTKFLRMFYDTATNFITTDWASAPNQPNAQTKHILWMGGSALNQRRKQGVLYGIKTDITS